MSEAPEPLRLDDGKDADALRTIGEVAAALGVRQHVLRYWEQQFPMLRPTKRSGGRRYYRPEDVRLAHIIDRLVNREGYTLKGARQAIENGTAQPAVVTTKRATAETASSVLPQLHAIRARLAKALQA